MTIHIGSRSVGDGAPVLIIAEAGVNHGGNLDTAKYLIDAAAWAGADAVKFQTFHADQLVLPSTPKAAYQLDASTETQYDMLKRLELPDYAWPILAAHCAMRDVLFLSTPFDSQSVDVLDPLVPAFKVASGDITNIPLLQHIASKGKPIILSTGMADFEEVCHALNTIEVDDCTDFVLLHCTSLYPAPPSRANLLAMKSLHDYFLCDVGYSDHTSGHTVAIAAVALGACVIEKHLTLSKAADGPDHVSSLTSQEFRVMVESIRETEHALGSEEKRPVDEELEMRKSARRSLVTRHAIETRTILQADMFIPLRPGTGVSPTALPKVVGRVTRHALPAMHILQWEDVA